jgi:hypothetical protein
MVLTPMVKHMLPANFTLISGQEDAINLTSLLGVNGDMDAGGLLAVVISRCMHEQQSCIRITSVVCS